MWSVITLAKGFRIDGMNALHKGLNQKLKHAKKMPKIVSKHGSEMQKTMQRKAPVDTGNLRRSITLNKKNSGLVAEVQPNTEYASYVEYGTRYMNAQPYVRPAFRLQRAKFLSDVHRTIKK